MFHPLNDNYKVQWVGRGTPHHMMMPMSMPMPVQQPLPMQQQQRAGGGKPKKGVIPPALRPWMAHLRAVHAKNPRLSLKQAMILARKSYQPKRRTK